MRDKPCLLMIMPHYILMLDLENVYLNKKKIKTNGIGNEKFWI